jgi:hypothetical protein
LGSRDSDSRSRVFRFLAPAFAAAALFHAVALARPEIAEPVPRWWHALFVVVNVLLAVGVVRRPRGFLVAFAIYTVQQLIEHGERGVRIGVTEHRLDWASLVSIVFVPIVLTLLVLDARGRPLRDSGGMKRPGQGVE